VLWRAWSEVAANGGAAGVDGVSIADVEERGVEGFLDALQVELKTGKYRPLPVRRVSIPNADFHAAISTPGSGELEVEAAVAPPGDRGVGG
jgi:RNA-directed DNA polymerase